MKQQLLQAGQKALDNFAKAMEKIKPISVNKCRFCDSKMIYDNGDYYHELREYPRVANCPHLDTFVPNQDKSKGKFFTVEMPYGSRNSWFHKL